MRPSRARRLALAVTGLLVLGACGGSARTDGAPVRAEGPTPAVESTAGGTASTTAAPGATPAAAPAAPSPLPDVAVLDAGTGETVQLAALLPADRPLLVWFWAPH